MPRPAVLHKVLSMRLVCPSCRAEYEVDLALLPTEGREVQCSACHFIWFQAHPDHPLPSAAEPVTVPELVPSPHITPETTTMPGRDTTPPDLMPADGVRTPRDTDAVGAVQSPRTVSGQALDILREEADFESRQRAREAEGLETQPELGLANPEPWPSTTHQETPGSDPGPQDIERPTIKAQTTHFPDIDDISTTLEPLGRSRGRTQEWDLPETAAEKRRSFLKGLALPLGLGALVVGPYLLAPTIIDAVPATETALTGYIAAIDGLRIRLADILGG